MEKSGELPVVVVLRFLFGKAHLGVTPVTIPILPQHSCYSLDGTVQCAFKAFQVDVTSASLRVVKMYHAK